MKDSSEEIDLPMKKVLVFHPALAPYRIDFFNLLSERVDLVVVFLLRNLEDQKFDQERLLSMTRFKYRFLDRGFNVRSRFFRFGVRKVLEEEQPDVVIGFEFSPLTCQLTHLSKNNRWRFWTTSDDNAMQIASCGGLRRVVRSFALRRLQGIIVTNDDSVVAYAQVCPSIKIKAVPIVHDTAQIRANEEKVFSIGKEWRKRNVPAEWKKLVVFVGRLAPEKNLHWLIERMKDAPEGLGLLIVGDGDERALLERQIAQNGLSNRVLLAGRFEGDALYGIMSVSDVLVLASTSEPFGAVVAEGLAWGTPVAVSDCVGAKVLVDDANGRIFPLFDQTKFWPCVMEAMSCKKGCRTLLRTDLKSTVDELAGAL